MSGAVLILGSSNINFVDCEIFHTGMYAVKLDSGSAYNLFDSCHIYDMGAGIRNSLMFNHEGGVWVTNNAHFTTVTNSYIHAGGRIWNAGIGVIAQNSHNNTISNNEIADLYYSGKWGKYPPEISEEFLLDGVGDSTQQMHTAIGLLITTYMILDRIY